MSDHPLNDSLLNAISRSGNVKVFPARVTIIHEDDDSKALYVILKGLVKAYGRNGDGREVVYNTMGPGEYFGEMTLDGGPRSASIDTLEATTCVVIGGVQAREFLAAHPEFALHLICKLIGLVRRSTANVKAFALEDVYQRIARLLDESAPPGPYPRRIPYKLTQEHIADRVGAGREMVNRIWRQLKEGGYVTRENGNKGHIVLLNRLPHKF